MFRLVLMCFTLSVVSVSYAFAEDIKGSSDHSEVGRFTGSEIIGYSYKDFNEYLLPEGEAVEGKDGKYYYAKSETVEGKVTRILYVAPEEASVAEVFRNYQKQLERKGFQRVFSCKGKEYECAYWMTGYMENFQPPLVKYPYEFDENRYISMKKSDPKGDIYVSLLVYNYKFNMYSERYKHPMVQLDVIESEPLNDSKIEVVTADKISQEIDAQGRIALYGIYFDTGKSDIKSESDAALNEIVKALDNQNSLKLHVVGHTDNTGSFDYNMVLSKKRANSVVAALVSRGINAARLTANGVSSLAPVASNMSEEGRAKNRRVELVAQ
ncbi:MAG TPA: DUF4892 domain-containing protein [Gammaproteobacteria bacterium]|nr:DUF4892 domain-containing protein [Gammaproteobacteria bacterium]